VTVVDDPYYGTIDVGALPRRVVPTRPLCQAMVKCERCSTACFGLVALVEHVADECPDRVITDRRALARLQAVA
jgi:hypothetical protein